MAEYLRLDARLFQNRLWIVAGARYERTYDDGYGPINDISRTYQRNAAGALIDGNPSLAGIQPIKIVGSALDLAKLQYVDRGTHVTKNFSTFIRRSMNWGVSLERPRYSVRLNWNLRGRQRQASIAGVAEPGTYAYMNPRLTLDADGEYRLTKAIGIFLGARNVTGRPFIVERYGPSTPAYARRYQRDDYGVAISLGLKGSF